MNSLSCSDPTHNDSAEFFCINPFCQEDRLICFAQCFKTGKHSQHTKDVEKISQLINYIEKMKQDCEELLDQINLFLQQVKINLDKLKQGIQSKYLISSIQLTQFNAKNINQVLTSIIQFKDYKKALLTSLQVNTTNYILNLNNLIEELQLYFNKTISVVNKIDYESIGKLKCDLLKDCSIKEEHCYALDFNKEATILAAGFISGKINVYQFKQEKLQLTQKLNTHQGCVYCLVFMKKSAQFISGGKDKKIIIWMINDKSLLWQVQQTLTGHLNTIFCLIINIDENLMVSGGDDNQIKFWKKNDWKCFQTLNCHKSRVLSLSLNEKYNKLISCASDKNLIVFIKQNEENWIVLQQIEFKQIPRRLCFIDDFTFTIQCEQEQVIYIYKQSQNDDYFKKADEFEVRGGERSCFFCFPQKFISSKQLLLNKNGDQVNFIRRNELNEFSTVYSIDYKAGQLWGTVSDDGQYLATWDNGSGQIQIRKYQE